MGAFSHLEGKAISLTMKLETYERVKSYLAEKERDAFRLYTQSNNTFYAASAYFLAGFNTDFMNKATFNESQNGHTATYEMSLMDGYNIIQHVGITVDAPAEFKNFCFAIQNRAQKDHGIEIAQKHNPAPIR